MSKRDALRELIRKFPPPPELDKILETLETQTDRSIAIVGVAVVEASIEKLIIKKLPVTTPRLIGRLFKNRGPLSDFDSKILMAHALDLFKEGWIELLHSVKSIRNVFAHSQIDVTFDTDEISKEIQRILIPAMTRIYKIFNDKLPEQPFSNKMAFIMAVRVACFLLNETYENLTGELLYGQRTSHKTSQ